MGCSISWDGIWDQIKGKREESQPNPRTRLSLFPNSACNITSCLTLLLPYLSALDYTLKSWTQMNSSSLKLLLIRYFVKVMRKVHDIILYSHIHIIHRHGYISMQTHRRGGGRVCSISQQAELLLPWDPGTMCTVHIGLMGLVGKSMWYQSPDYSLSSKLHWFLRWCCGYDFTSSLHWPF